MKTRFCTALLLAAFFVTLFTGCATAAMPEPLVAPEIVIATQPMARTATGEATTAPTPAATPAATGPSHSQPQYISKEEANTIALNHAGLAAKDVTGLKAELDFDHGQAEYEVEFHYSGYEYDYEIDAESGKIISWDKDLEDR